MLGTTCSVLAYSVSHCSMHSSQEHHIPQEKGNGKVKMDEIMDAGEHGFAAGTDPMRS